MFVVYSLIFFAFAPLSLGVNRPYVQNCKRAKANVFILNTDGYEYVIQIDQ